MKRTLIFAASATALLISSGAVAGHDDDDNKHDHDKVTQTLDLTGFDKIDVSGVYDIDVVIGSKFSVELSGPEDEMALVETSVEDGVLHLDRRDRKRSEKWKRRNHDHGVDAKITMPSLMALDVSGVVDGRVRGIDSENFEVGISGVGDMDLSGECGSLDANISGVGDLDARDLECRSVDVKVSGVGDASVFARDEVDARVSGMGDIEVYGSPEKVSKSDSMFAEVTVH